MNIENRIKNLPKVELHLHLDGSLSQQFIEKRAKIRNIQIQQNLQQYIVNLFLKQQFDENWEAFDFCNQFLQTEEELQEATMDLCQRLLQQNVQYAEIRFCPSLHQKEGLSLDQVIQSVVQGFQNSQQNTVLQGGIIISALCSQPIQQILELIEITKKWLNKGIIGFDRAGNEKLYPLILHKQELQLVNQYQIPLTVHCCEFENTEENIYTALQLGVKRIGHGLKLDYNGIQQILKNSITIECCISSNVGWGNIDKMKSHPIKSLFDQGVRVTLNSDNMMITGKQLMISNNQNEILNCVQYLDFEIKQIKEMIKYAIEARFAKVDQQWLDRFYHDLDLA